MTKDNQKQIGSANLKSLGSFKNICFIFFLLACTSVSSQVSIYNGKWNSSYPSATGWTDLGQTELNGQVIEAMINLPTTNPETIGYFKTGIANIGADSLELALRRIELNAVDETFSRTHWVVHLIEGHFAGEEPEWIVNITGSILHYSLPPGDSLSHALSFEFDPGEAVGCSSYRFEVINYSDYSEVFASFDITWDHSYGANACVSATDEYERADTRVYPNPSQGLVHVKVAPEYGSYDCYLYNVMGSPVTLWQNNTHISSTDLTDVAPGIYSLTITSTDRKWSNTQRLVIGE